MHPTTRTLLVAAVCVSIGSVAQNEKKPGVLTGTGNAAKMALAHQRMLAGEYVSALNLYREIVNSDPNEYNARYNVALCQYHLEKYADAMASAEDAAQRKEVRPEVHYLLAKLYQKDEKPEKAIEHSKTYLSGNTSSEEAAETELVLSQCTNATKLLASPLQVVVENMGEAVNSKYDDKNPCITADGRQLIFTTRRPETTSSIVDVEGDGKYFEDIYLSAPDSTGRMKKAWPAGKPINTVAYDACTGISADGKQIFIYRNDATKSSSRGGDLFVSRVVNGKWKKPESLGKPINSSYWDGGACVSPDGKKYFFTSERPGGYGHSDIWMVEKKNKTEWGEPVNLGPEVNSAYDEAGMFLAPDGKTLFFCSNGPRSMSDYDIFRSVFENGKWSAPQNLGYPINTMHKEGQLTISADARYAYLSSTRSGGIGESDLYRVELKDYAILEKDFKKSGTGLVVLKGTIREGGEGYGIPDVEITVQDQSKNSHSTTTGETGEYFFSLPSGKYTVTVQKKGYHPITEEMDLGGNGKQVSVVEKGYLLKK